MNPSRKHRTLSLSPRPTHEDDLADLVVAATRGDLRAVDALADGYYRVLLAEARDVLGPCQEEDAEDVVEDFFLSLCEGKNRFLPKRHDALAWMGRIVRAIAQTRRYEEEGDHE